MLTTIHEKILNYVGLDWVPIVIVGNKLDLIQNGGLNRQVEQSDVAALAKEWNCTSTESKNTILNFFFEIDFFLFYRFGKVKLGMTYLSFFILS